MNRRVLRTCIAALTLFAVFLSPLCAAASWDWPDWDWPYESAELSADIPASLAMETPSVELADISMRCPLIFKVWGMSSAADASGAVGLLEGKSVAFRELMSREDANSALVSYYCTKEIDKSPFAPLTPRERRDRGMEIMIKTGEFGFQFIENMFIEYTFAEGGLVPSPASCLSEEDTERFMEKFRERRYTLFPPASLSDPRLEPLRFTGDVRFCKR